MTPPATMSRFMDAEFTGTDDPWPDRLTCYFDGLCEPTNPGGVATVGWVVTETARPDAVQCQFSGVLAHGGNWATNNVAEWVAFGMLLRFLVDRRPAVGEVTVFGDSQLVVNQFNGDWAVRSPRIVPFYERAVELKQCNDISLRLHHVCRAGNNVADALSEAAFYRYAARVDPRLADRFRVVKAQRAAQKAGGKPPVSRATAEFRSYVAGKVSRLRRDITPRTAIQYNARRASRPGGKTDGQANPDAPLHGGETAAEL